MRIPHPVTILVVALLITSCRPAKNTGEAAATTPSVACQPATAETPQIMLLNFELLSTDSVRLINTIVNVGNLREKLPIDASPAPGDLIISFLTEEMGYCFSRVVANPLVRKAEFSNDFTVLQAVTIETDEAIFPLRVQYNSQLKFVLVEKANESLTDTLGIFRIPL